MALVPSELNNCERVWMLESKMASMPEQQVP